MQESDNCLGSENLKILLGNKCDLRSQKVIDYDNGKKFANALDIPFLETSAKNTTNVEEAFYELAEELLSKYHKKSSDSFIDNCFLRLILFS